MTKTNEPLNNSELLETFNSPGENYVFHPLTKPKTNKSRRWKHTKPDLQKQCLLCDNQIKVKYILPKQQYSQKNNWGYWTGKESDKHRYICNNCLIKLYDGNINDWINDETRADVFYNYVKRGQFKKTNN